MEPFEEIEQRRPVEFGIDPIQIHMLCPVENYELGMRLDLAVHGRYFIARTMRQVAGRQTFLSGDLPSWPMRPRVAVRRRADCFAA